MASANSITSPRLPSSPTTLGLRAQPKPRPHNDLLVAYLSVARTAADRARRATNCPDVLHLVRTAEHNLAAAHDLVLTDREWAA